MSTRRPPAPPGRSTRCNLALGGTLHAYSPTPHLHLTYTSPAPHLHLTYTSPTPHLPATLAHLGPPQPNPAHLGPHLCRATAPSTAPRSTCRSSTRSSAPSSAPPRSSTSCCPRGAAAVHSAAPPVRATIPPLRPRTAARAASALARAAHLPGGALQRHRLAAPSSRSAGAVVPLWG